MAHPAARARYDVALTMYHDQGLFPVKMLDFAHGVNVTLGLPFVRTSPDHGTAYDIAGTGKADPSSLIAAIKMADQMARDIIAFGVLDSVDPNHKTTFHITSLRNDSGDVINREIILRKLRTDLFQAMGGRVRVLDRSAEGLEAVRAEREAKRAGAVSSNPNRRGDVLGSDFVLKGTIQDRAISDGRLKSVYYLVTFELTDLETGELRWTNDYEAKFLSEKSVISR